uniref:Uncharacterized protein n=1 Tax=Nymphaea colorata TaxID=210225 RepID=A0A5K1C8D4_9MAGN
MHLNALGL